MIRKPYARASMLALSCVASAGAALRCVDPSVLSFEPRSRALARYEGRTVLKRRDGNSWREFDGVTVYRLESR